MSKVENRAQDAGNISSFHEARKEMAPGASEVLGLGMI